MDLDHSLDDTCEDCFECSELCIGYCPATESAEPADCNRGPLGHDCRGCEGPQYHDWDTEDN